MQQTKLTLISANQFNSALLCWLESLLVALRHDVSVVYIECNCMNSELL